MMFRATMMGRPSDGTHSPPITRKGLRSFAYNPRGLLIGNGVSPDAADDTGDAPYRPNVNVNDVPRDDIGPPERWNA